ncbi:MAG: MoaD/ThiS family protein [Cyclobacteriaceae bacterium]
MATVKFTANLKRFYPELRAMEIEARNVSDLLEELETKFPKIKHYLVDEQGRLRKHVNIFIGDELIEDRQGLTDEINSGQDIYIMQALSGG